METRESIMAKINKDIDEMIEPADRLCAVVATNLGQVIAMLLTNRDHKRLDELKRICDELFSEAQRAKDATPRTIQ